MSVYLIQPAELAGTNHYVLGTDPLRKQARIVIHMETSEPEKVKSLIRLRFQEGHVVHDDHVEGKAKELRALFYLAVLTYEDSLPVKMDIDENTIVKYLRK